MEFAPVVCDTWLLRPTNFAAKRKTRSKGTAMSKSNKGKKERKPVVLSKDEALYPPSTRSLILAIAAIGVGVIAIIVFLVMYPPF